VVPPVLHRDGIAGHLDDEHVLDRWAGFQRFVGIGLERDLTAAAAALVGGDQQR
jgi:hypothetical protein